MFAPVAYVVVVLVIIIGFYRIENNRIMKRRAYKGSARLPRYYTANRRK